MIAAAAMTALLGGAIPAIAQADAGEVPKTTLDLRDQGGLLEGSAFTDIGRIDFDVDYALAQAYTVGYLMNGKRIEWSIDLGGEQTLTLEGRDLKTGAVSKMEERDKAAFDQLLYAFELYRHKLDAIEDPANKEAVRILVKTSELLSTYGVGLDLEGQTRIDSARAITSLCSAVGTWRNAYWDANGTNKVKAFVVGGHGVCKGHCGGGCPSGDREYTQDCLNHDACVGEEGACAACPVGVCGDEWWAASDDYVSAPSCD
ncbi:MAG: hypothetical protein AAGC60_13565 [Acidobacteriota bacterium]